MPEFIDTLRNLILPLVAAPCLGAVVGWDREVWNKPAGLRTHMIVALGSSAFTLLSLRAVFGGEAAGAGGGDPARIVAGVATGLGFLGAGSIIQSQGEVRGLTTAAGIWVVGAVGACCGAGQYDLAIVAVLLAFVILTALKRIERFFGSGPGS